MFMDDVNVENCHHAVEADAMGTGALVNGRADISSIYENGKACEHRPLDSTGNGRSLENSSEHDEEFFLTHHQIENAVNAFCFSDSLNKPLNCTIDIAWSESDRWKGAERVSEAQNYTFRRISTFLKKKGLGFFGLWTRENGKVMGVHTHLMMHLPVQLRNHVCRMIVADGAFSERGVRITAKMHTDNMRFGKFRYIAKNIRPENRFAMADDTDKSLSERYSALLDIRPESGGKVLFKRAGTSLALGSASRRRAGWEEISVTRQPAFAAQSGFPEACGGSEIDVVLPDAEEPLIDPATSELPKPDRDIPALQDRVAKALLEKFSDRHFFDCLGNNGRNFGTTFEIARLVLNDFPDERNEVMEILGFLIVDPDE